MNKTRTDYGSRIQESFESSQSGDAVALGKFIELVRPHVLITCYRLIGNAQDAEDAAQDGLIKIIELLGEQQVQETWQSLVYVSAIQAALSIIDRTTQHDEMLRKHLERNGSPAQKTEARIEPLLTASYPLLDIQELERYGKSHITTLESLSYVFVNMLSLLPAKTRAAFLGREILGQDALLISRAVDLPAADFEQHLEKANRIINAAIEQMPRDTILSSSPMAKQIAEMLGRHLVNRDLESLTELLDDEVVLALSRVGSFQGLEIVVKEISRMSNVGLAPDITRYIEVNGQPGLVCFQKRKKAHTTKAYPFMIVALAISAAPAKNDLVTRIDLITHTDIAYRIGKTLNIGMEIGDL